MKQTAVEWLEEELADNLKLIILNNDFRMMEKLFEQAKKMEKEQIIDAYEKGKKYKKPIKDSNPIWLNSKPYKKK